MVGRQFFPQWLIELLQRKLRWAEVFVAERLQEMNWHLKWLRGQLPPEQSFKANLDIVEWRLMFLSLFCLFFFNDEGQKIIVADARLRSDVSVAAFIFVYRYLFLICAWVTSEPTAWGFNAIFLTIVPFKKQQQLRCWIIDVTIQEILVMTLCLFKQDLWQSLTASL